MSIYAYGEPKGHPIAKTQAQENIDIPLSVNISNPLLSKFCGHENPCHSFMGQGDILLQVFHQVLDKADLTISTDHLCSNRLEMVEKVFDALIREAAGAVKHVGHDESYF
jgi:hypothetical protein